MYVINCVRAAAYMRHSYDQVVCERGARLSGRLAWTHGSWVLRRRLGFCVVRTKALCLCAHLLVIILIIVYTSDMYLKMVILLYLSFTYKTEILNKCVIKMSEGNRFP